MDIKKATLEDLQEVQELVHETIMDMNANGIYQWNDIYPPIYKFRVDIEVGELHVARIDGELAGIIVLNDKEDEEYGSVQWMSKGRPIVVHRMAVHPNFQRRGVASALLDYAEVVGRDNGFDCLRIDTYSENPRSLGLFNKRGYDQMPGQIHFPENQEPYYCYEVRL